MLVLIEVAAVDSGWRREEVALWCQPTPLACQPASPAGVQSPTPLALSSALPYIRQTLGLLLPTKHQCSTSFFRRVALGCCVYGWRLTLRYRQAPGWRTAGSLATELSRIGVFVVWCTLVHTGELCGAQSPEEVSGVPTSSQPAAHQVHQMHH